MMLRRLRHDMQWAHRAAWELTDYSMQTHPAYALGYPLLLAVGLLTMLSITVAEVELRWRHPRQKGCRAHGE